MHGGALPAAGLAAVLIGWQGTYRRDFGSTPRKSCRAAQRLVTWGELLEINRRKTEPSTLKSFSQGRTCLSGFGEVYAQNYEIYGADGQT